MEQENITEVVTKLFVYTDQNNWSGVAEQFSEQVLLDYSSMTGNPAESLSPQQITASWKSILPGFTHTHHQIGNVITTSDGQRAHVFCYGTATHYLEDDHGSIWTVVGTYDFDLKQMDGQWKITSMIFNYKYQDGNADLIQRAIAKVNSKN